MSSHSFSIAFAVEQTPEEAYAAICNVRGWWTGQVDGDTAEVGDEFAYRYGDVHYSKQKVVELVPGEKVVWRVLDAKIAYNADPAEWTGTDILFDITRKEDQTEVRFTHRGLRSDFECFDSCANAWGFYINGSLRKLITTGEGPTTPPWA